MIEAGITHVAFRGTIGHSGDGLLDIRAPEEVLVRGGVSGAAIDTGSQGRLRINANGFGVTSPATACADRYAADPSAITEMVIRNGSLSASGGGSDVAVLDHAPPHGRDHLGQPGQHRSRLLSGAVRQHPGRVSSAWAAAAGVQWTAPNTVLGEPTVGAYRFEDLAVWSETQRDNLVSGGGVTVLKGVFFLPNTGPSQRAGWAPDRRHLVEPHPARRPAVGAQARPQRQPAALDAGQPGRQHQGAVPGRGRTRPVVPVSPVRATSRR